MIPARLLPMLQYRRLGLAGEGVAIEPQDSGELTRALPRTRIARALPRPRIARALPR